MLIEARHHLDPVVVRLGEEQQRELAGVVGEQHVEHPVRRGVEFLVGFVNDRPVACGALQPLSGGVGEIKRMYVRPAHRGQGLSRLILAALEEHAFQSGYHTVRVETGRQLVAALALYRAAGYRPIPRFGEYAGNPLSVCFEKSLLAVELSPGGAPVPQVPGPPQVPAVPEVSREPAA